MTAPPTDGRKPLRFTFGNHMHWVDMEWLWGYGVLPSSVRDMLGLCEATGAKGNVNFDGVGYERLAVEAPGALAELREAVQAGRIEVVGASYGQPYGVLHGGESNVRQRVYGARSVRRLLGVWPRTFWEEEFDWYPQLPQILAGCGFTGASLFFQWTWHTPTVPEEDVPVVLWEGIDGTRLPALAKTELCLHQWPEDFEGRLDGELAQRSPAPALVQWLELLPSPDWMCRSEVILPRLRELFADSRFEVRPVTLGELLAELGEGAPVRRYTMDDVWHGFSLGKNGDWMRRLSAQAEHALLAAESASATAGLLGRPYPSWSVYPTWELEEGWRELLQAQHHDNDECEGLCGFVGERSYEKAAGLAEHVLERTVAHLARRAAPPASAGEPSSVWVNPTGWPRRARARVGGGVRTVEVPPFGYAATSGDLELSWPGRLVGDRLRLDSGDLEIEIDRERGRIAQIRAACFPDGVLGAPLLDFAMTLGGRSERFDEVTVEDEASELGTSVTVRRRGPGGELEIELTLRDDPPALAIGIASLELARPDPAMHAGLRLPLQPRLSGWRLLHDTPYAVAEIRAERDHVRKYPTGDWMTSSQRFETVRRPFTAWSFADVDAGDRGVLWVHDGSQAFFRTEHGIDQLLSMYDAWDERHWRPQLDARVWIVPHGRLDHAGRWRLATELRRPLQAASKEDATAPDAPPAMGAVEVEPDHVVAAAWYRESAHAAEHVTGHFAAGGVRDPYVLRLVELRGERAAVTVRVPGPVAAAARTDLLGAVVEDLRPEACPAPSWAPSGPDWHALRLELGPYRIATVMLDLELGRHVPRDLDAHRHVWATVHR